MTEPHSRDIAASPPRTPGWVKAIGILALVLVLLLVGLHLLGSVPTHVQAP